QNSFACGLTETSIEGTFVRRSGMPLEICVPLTITAGRFPRHHKAKRHPDRSQGAFYKDGRNYFVPRIASFAALATRNLTTRFAAILMVSPVAGLRPMRALRFTNTSLPRPGSVKVFLAFLQARSAMLSRISAACFLL